MGFPQLRSKLLNQLATTVVAGAYSLAAAAGAVTVTGSSASPELGHVVAASAGSFAVTGTAAAPEVGYRLTSDSGSVAVTGIDAALTQASPTDKISVNYDWQRSYPRAFQPAVFGPKGFGFVVTLTDYTLTADVTGYDWTGTAATLPLTRFVTGASASFAVTGTDVSFTKQFTLSAATGNLNTSGTPATLSAVRQVTADTAEYAATGTAASLVKGIYVVASATSYDWTGTNATVVRGLLLTSDSASYAVGGTDATLRGVANAGMSVNYDWQREYPRAFHPSHRKPFKFAVAATQTVIAGEGAYDVTGGTAGLTYQQITPTISQRGKAKRTWPRQFAPSPFGQLRSTRTANLIGTPAGAAAVDATSGVFTATGTPFTTLSVVRQLNISTGSISVTGQDVTFLVKMPVDTGNYSAAGTAASLLKTSYISSGIGGYVWTGASVNLNKGFTLSASSGTYPWTGTDARLSTFIPDAGAYIWTGTTAVLIYSGEPIPTGPPAGSRMLRGYGI